MSGRALRRLLGGYFAFLVLALLVVRAWFSLSPLGDAIVVESWWKGGKRVARQVYPTTEAARHAGNVAANDTSVVTETVVGRAPLYLHPLFFTLGLVPGRDGVEARLGDRVVYATVDDILSVQAYDRAHLWVEASFGWGTHFAAVMQILADQLKVLPQELAAKGTFARVRFERKTKREASAPVGSAPPRPAPALDVTKSSRAFVPPEPSPSTFAWPADIRENALTRELVLAGVREAATHLARAVDAEGAFRYMIDAPTNLTFNGYNWPRHSGATFFLAQAAHVLDDPFVRWAALRAASKLRDEMVRNCGANWCIAAEGDSAEIGSSALAIIAFTELVRTGADTSYRPTVEKLAAFLRSQQRPDGEMMHVYDRAANKPVDIQLLYFTGEATLALARTHAITGNPADLEASRRALARLSGAGWSFFGSRYYFSEEHWTCQAVAELWARSPSEEALAFCSRWHEYQRRLQQTADDTPFDAEGAFGFGPLVVPRVTPASSRGEAAGALAVVLRQEQSAGRHSRDAELPLVERELRRALAFVLRSQFHPGPSHLFADPVAVRGAVPGSPVDWQLRIDYSQHAGSMMLRWLELDGLAH